MLRIHKSSYLLFNTISVLFLSNGLRLLLSRPLPDHLKQAGHFQFLTNLSLAFTIISLTIEVLSILNLIPNLIANYFLLISFVLEFIVSAIYWTLKLFLIHLIVNVDKLSPEKFIPLSLDLTIHLCPLIILSINIILLKKKQPKKSMLSIFIIVLILSFAYWNILETLVSKAKIIDPLTEYPYPFLNVESTQRIIIFGGVSVVGILVVLIVEFITELVEDLLTKEKKD